VRFLGLAVASWSASLSLLAGTADAAAPRPGKPLVIVADVDSEIHAVTASFVGRVIHEAEQKNAVAIVLRLDTPGGRLDSTRELTRTILSSRVPVVGYVSPPGAQAASAGFLVLMACDVAAMAPGTNTGAASPVGGSGEDLPRTMKKKVTEDMSALLRSVVVPRGRPIQPAVDAVEEALSYSETEAKEKKLVEVVASDLTDLLKQLDGRAVKRVGKPDSVLVTAGAIVKETEMTGLQRALAVIASPAVAGLLFLIGLVGLYSEMSHPGAILPGVLGGICLLLALFALSVLPTNWAGIGLMLLGVLFFFLEIQLASHGLFAIGGGVSMILGAVLLFHREEGAPRFDFWFVTVAAAATAAILAALSFKALSVQSLPVTTGEGALVGQVVRARSAIHQTGRVFADGAVWEARSAVPVAEGAQVEIVGVEGLLLLVRPAAADPGVTAPKAPERTA